MDRSVRPASPAPEALTSQGVLAGLRLGDVDAFLGVPYAAPPVGAHRWRPPQPLTAWHGVRQATQFGPSAWQAVAPEGFGPWTREFVVQGPVSEDCLHLNIWAPHDARGDRLPVLVWIHGGAFVQGSGSVPIYDGRSLAARGVVVVSINYRLGALGFLAHPDLAREAEASAYGNFGLQDQLAALRWVQANIADFGGDPGAVTLAGQSAGSLCVHMLMASPTSAGLFHRAIALSGPPTLVALSTRDQAEADGMTFAIEHTRPDIQSLRALPAEELTRHLSPATRTMPMIGGALLPAWPPRPSETGLGDVPMIVGHTADEGSALDPDHGSPDPRVLSTLLDRLGGEQATALCEHYLASTRGDVAAARRAASADHWSAATWAWAEHRVQSGRPAVHACVFEHILPGPESMRYRAFHSSDLPYWLATLSAACGRDLAVDDHRVSAIASEYLLNFVRRGDPNGGALPNWPVLRRDVPRVLRINSSPSTASLLPAMRPDLREAWLARCRAMPLVP